MKYNLTEKLKFSEDPVLVIQDKELTIKSDAVTVLQLMDTLKEKGEATAARDATELLLSPADRKKLSLLNLKMDDYLTVVRTMVQVALGSDPDEDQPGE